MADFRRVGDRVINLEAITDFTWLQPGEFPYDKRAGNGVPVSFVNESTRVEVYLDSTGYQDGGYCDPRILVFSEGAAEQFLAETGFPEIFEVDDTLNAEAQKNLDAHNADYERTGEYHNEFTDYVLGGEKACS